MCNWVNAPVWAQGLTLMQAPGQTGQGTYSFKYEDIKKITPNARDFWNNSSSISHTSRFKQVFKGYVMFKLIPIKWYCVQTPSSVVSLKVIVCITFTCFLHVTQHLKHWTVWTRTHLLAKFFISRWEPVQKKHWKTNRLDELPIIGYWQKDFWHDTSFVSSSNVFNLL